MNTAEKNLFIKKLSSDDAQIVSTLHYFRSNSDLSLIPNILQLLESDRSPIVKNAVLELCKDVREPEIANVIFDYLTIATNATVQQQLLTTIWHTGLDFSHKAENIIDIILTTNNFEIAFEALTVLENCTENITKDMVNNLYNKIEQTNNPHPTTQSIVSTAKNYLLKKL